MTKSNPTKSNNHCMGTWFSQVQIFLDIVHISYTLYSDGQTQSDASVYSMK